MSDGGCGLRFSLTAEVRHGRLVRAGGALGGGMDSLFVKGLIYVAICLVLVGCAGPQRGERGCGGYLGGMCTGSFVGF